MKELKNPLVLAYLSGALVLLLLAGLRVLWLEHQKCDETPPAAVKKFIPVEKAGLSFQVYRVG